MVEPAHAEVEAGNVFVLSGCGDGFLHCWDGLSVAAEVGLKNGQVEQGILIESLITVLHGVVEVAVQVVEA